MPDHQREIYHSENGDRWLLCRDDDGRVPEHQALVSLIAELIDKA